MGREWLLLFLLHSWILVVVGAIVCLPDSCKDVVQPRLNCVSGVVLKGGVCGCTDVCAQAEGESCKSPSPLLGAVGPQKQCGEGLVCLPDSRRGFLGEGTCVKVR